MITQIKLQIQCECGNERFYIVRNEYHSHAHEVYIDLTENIYDDGFQAKPTPDGMWVNCRKCNKSFEII